MASVLSTNTEADNGQILRPSHEEIRAQLDTILASEHFCTSKRASEFLHFIVEHTLSGDLDSLKERLLGIEIFRRRSDYDTSSDAIVRVTANDVRKRLTNFDHAQLTEPVRILLPPGSYVPDFFKRDIGPTASAVEEPDVLHTLVGGLSHHLEESTVPAQVSAPDTPSMELAAKTPKTLSRNLIIAAVLVAATAGWFGALLFGSARLSHPSGQLRFYDDLLGPIGLKGDAQTEIALSNPRLAIYRGTVSPIPSKEDEIADVPVPNDMASQLNATANDVQGNYPFHYLQVDDKNYTGVGEAEVAFAFSHLMQMTGRSARLTQARFLTWDRAKEQQLILLGAPHMSAFAQESLRESNFVMDHDEIRNLRPQSGEQAVYARTVNGSQLEDYGLIWMGRSPAGSRVLVIAGLTSTGTAGVGQFFTDPSLMRPVYEQLRSLSKSGNFPESWQVLLRIDARADVPVNTTAIAVRIAKSN